MSDGELHASLGLHRGRRALAAALALGLAAVLLSAVSGEPTPEPLTPPSVTEAARTVTPPSPPPRPVKRPSRAPKPSRAPVVVAEVPAPVAPPEPPPAVIDAPPDAPPAEPAEEVQSAAPPPPAEELLPSGNGESIARAIAAEQRAAVRACFEHELKEQPTLTGTVVVELDLAPPARVDGVRVSDDLNRPTFTRCVSSAMLHARFASLDEEISVRVPYVLSPERK